MGLLKQLLKKNDYSYQEKRPLPKTFGGIEDMNRLPGAIFVVDIRRTHSYQRS